MVSEAVTQQSRAILEGGYTPQPIASCHCDDKGHKLITLHGGICVPSLVSLETGREEIQLSVL